MIPKVQTWRVRVLADEYGPEAIVYMDGPTKTLIRIGFRMDYPCYWGRAIKISLVRKGQKV